VVKREKGKTKTEVLKVTQDRPTVWGDIAQRGRPILTVYGNSRTIRRGEGQKGGKKLLLNTIIREGPLAAVTVEPSERRQSHPEISKIGNVKQKPPNLRGKSAKSKKKKGDKKNLWEGAKACTSITQSPRSQPGTVGECKNKKRGKPAETRGKETSTVPKKKGGESDGEGERRGEGPDDHRVARAFSPAHSGNRRPCRGRGAKSQETVLESSGLCLLVRGRRGKRKEASRGARRT